MMFSETVLAERIACPDCGLMQLLPSPAPGQKAECARCLKVLAGSATGRIGAPLALAISALLLLVPATIAPLMVVDGAALIGIFDVGKSSNGVFQLTLNDWIWQFIASSIYVKIASHLA